MSGLHAAHQHEGRHQAQISLATCGTFHVPLRIEGDGQFPTTKKNPGE
jgi:hypothetical protein